LATITLNLSDELANEFRRTAALVEGTGKGHLSKAVSEALQAWIRLKGCKETTPETRLLAAMNKGYHFGGRIPSREEIHSRRF